MKKEWAEELLEIVQGAKEGLLKGIEVAQEQAPLVVQELLKWQYTLHLIGWVAGIVMLVCGIIGIARFIKQIESDSVKDHSPEEAFYGVAIVASLLISIAGLPLFIHQFIMWLKILIAPKVYLIQYLCQVMRGQ